MNIPKEVFYQKAQANGARVEYDHTGQYAITEFPGEPKRLWHLGIDLAFLLVEGDEVEKWREEFRIPRSG